MREVDHDADAVQFGDDLLAEIAQAVVQPLAGRLAGIRVGELAVTVVREREIPRAARMELLDALDGGGGVPEGVAVFHADERDLLAGLADPPDVGGGERQLDLVGRDLLGETMDRVEFRDCLLVSAVVALGGERTLPDVDDEERRVEAAGSHLRQVDLIAEILRVVALRREVGDVDVVVRVERDDPFVNRARLLDERVVRRASRFVQLGRPAPRRRRAPPRRTRNVGACHPRSSAEDHSAD